MSPPDFQRSFYGQLVTLSHSLILRLCLLIIISLSMKLRNSVLFFFVFISRYIIRTRYTHQQLLFPFNAVCNAKFCCVSVIFLFSLSLSLFGAALSKFMWKWQKQYHLILSFTLLTLSYLYLCVYIVCMVHQFISITKILNFVLLCYIDNEL